MSAFVQKVNEWRMQGHKQLVVSTSRPMGADTKSADPTDSPPLRECDSLINQGGTEHQALCETRGRCCRMLDMDLAHISSAAELLKVEHPHFGRIHRPGFLKATIGTVTGTTQKAAAIADYSSGMRQTVAVQIDPRNFMVTIASSYVLVTLKEGVSRHPVIHKTWKPVGQRKGKEVTEFFGTVHTYIDSDGLKWEHRFERTPHEDELIAFGSSGVEILIITLESIYPTTAPGLSSVVISPSP